MCNRYKYPSDVTLKTKLREIIVAEKEMPASYNTAPTELAPVITNTKPEAVQYFRWGLIPSWAKDMKTGFLTTNARAETLTTTKSYSGLISKRRCLVVADGFYEWNKKGDDPKQPYFIHAKSEFTIFAGLWTVWKNPATDSWLPSFTIVTCAPNDFMHSLHDRMPVILDEEKQKLWLDNELPEKELLSLLQPYPDDQMAAYLVSKSVNNVRNKEASVAMPIVGNNGQ